MNSNKPLVSVCMITYNHENFILEAIESIVNQETSFSFELVISEDCGRDNTREICEEYKAKYPDIIRLNFKAYNQGPQPNFIQNIESCESKYIALCEGDDYWIDNHKLQKQIDFMEIHPEYSMCAHAAQITYDNKEFFDNDLDKSEFTTEDILLQAWGIMTASILFRREYFNPPKWFVKVKNGDFALQLLLSLHGKIAYLHDLMSVYRQHPGGISATLNPLNQASWLAYLLFEFNIFTKCKYKKLIKQRIKHMYRTQIGFAKKYHLRRQVAKLKYYQSLNSIAPFYIRHTRK